MLYLKKGWKIMNLNLKRFAFFAFSIFFTSSLYGDVLIPSDQCALIVASRSTKSEVKDYINNEIKNTKYVTIYKANNGWYAIALGFLKDSEKDSIISKWKRSAKIPHDSFCAKSYKFKEEIHIDFSNANNSYESYHSNNYSKVYNDDSINQNFMEMINNFRSTGNRKYLKQAGKLSKTKKEDLIVEKLLLENTPLEKIFSINEMSNSSKSDYHDRIGEIIPVLGKITEISTSEKELNKRFELKSNSKMVGNYKVTVNFIVTTIWNAETVNDSNFLGKLYNVMGSAIPSKDKKTYSQEFYINKNNNFKDTKNVRFKLLNISIGALGIRANTKIRSIKYTTEIVDVSLIK
jgi:hypothetical protein